MSLFLGTGLFYGQRADGTAWPRTLLRWTCYLMGA